MSSSTKLPVPIEIQDFRFWVSNVAPNFTVLEFDTVTNPIRVVLSREQLMRLAQEALTARARL
jgi:hypothetical protein